MHQQQLCKRRIFLSHNVEMNNKRILLFTITSIIVINSSCNMSVNCTNCVLLGIAIMSQ